MNNTQFVFTSLHSNIHFGHGKLNQLHSLLANYPHAFVIGEARVKPHIDQLAQQLGKNKVTHFGQVVQHVPQTLVQTALAALHASQAQVLVAIGGGSAIGLAKALALETKLPIIAVPTTYAGSEMTNIWGISTPQGKTTGRHNSVLPLHVIYDPQLTASMPVGLAATSALNANAHLMEAIYAHNTNPVTYTASLYGMKQIMSGLQLLSHASQLTPQANQQLLLGCFLAGKGLREVSMSLHHKAAHVLGGSFNLEHSHVHAVLQAYVLAYQWPSLGQQVQADFQEALGHQYPPLALQQAAHAAGAPTTLAAIGFQEQNIESAAEIMMQKPYANPAPLTKTGIIGLLTNAFHGTMAGSL